MNKNSQHEFRFSSPDDLQIACTRWQSWGPARGVVQFMNDPLCFPTLQPKSTESFLAASARLAGADALCKIRSGLPVYLFCGSEDPIGQQLQGIRTLIARYRQAGIGNISTIITKEGSTKC
jgi:alpha-beta hydrolase superfamily lysophospholipase